MYNSTVFITFYIFGNRTSKKLKYLNKKWRVVIYLVKKSLIPKLYPSIHLSIYLSIYTYQQKMLTSFVTGLVLLLHFQTSSLHIAFYFSVSDFSIYLSIYLSVYQLSIYLSIYITIYLSIHLSIYLSMTGFEVYYVFLIDFGLGAIIISTFLASMGTFRDHDK